MFAKLCHSLVKRANSSNSLGKFRCDHCRAICTPQAPYGVLIPILLLAATMPSPGTTLAPAITSTPAASTLGACNVPGCYLDHDCACPSISSSLSHNCLGGNTGNLPHGPFAAWPTACVELHEKLLTPALLLAATTAALISTAAPASTAAPSTTTTGGCTHLMLP